MAHSIKTVYVVHHSHTDIAPPMSAASIPAFRDCPSR